MYVRVYYVVVPSKSNMTDLKHIFIKPLTKSNQAKLKWPKTKNQALILKNLFTMTSHNMTPREYIESENKSNQVVVWSK